MTTIAVSGVSGALAGSSLHHLLGRDADVRASSRTPQHVDAAVPVLAADFDDERSLVDAWSGADVLVLVPGGAPGGVRLDQHRRALRAAASAGVRHVVYPGVVAHGDPPTLADDHLATERLVRASGLAWTIVRNGIYADSSVDRALTGELVFGGGSGQVAWAAREDLGEALALVAIDHARHAGTILELTGPRALSLEGLGAAVAAATGRDVAVSALDADAFAAGLAANGLPDPVFAAMGGTAAAIEAGLLAAVSGDLERILGRAPRTVEELAHERLAAATQ